MERQYSSFWIDYCNGAVVLDQEFADRDQMYYEESEHNHLNIRGKVVTAYGRGYVEGAGIKACDIEGKQI